MDDDMIGRAQALIDALPHARALGMRIVDVGAGTAAIEMPYDARFVGDAATGVLHGGAVSALMDTTSGAAVMAHPEGPGLAATIDLRIDYMRLATPGQTIRAEAECYHLTRHVAFIRASASDDDRDRPVAAATGTFTLRSDG